MVKCRAHWHPGQTQRFRVEAKLFADAASARERVEHVRRAGLDPVLQEAVDGGLGALIGLFLDGRLNGRVQQVTSRLWPTPSGVSCRAETVAVDDDLASRAERLLGDLGWSGLVELQFLTDADGAPHLIDLNGRFYGSMALADAAHPGLADAWARLVSGRSVPHLPDARAGSVSPGPQGTCGAPGRSDGAAWCPTSRTPSAGRGGRARASGTAAIPVPPGTWQRLGCAVPRSSRSLPAPGDE